MPSVTSLGGTRVLQRFVLKPFVRQPDKPSEEKEAVPVCRHQVRHCASLPAMVVQPEAAVHGMYHPVAATHELSNFQKVFLLGCHMTQS
jgi:hypothetical protein